MDSPGVCRFGAHDVVFDDRLEDQAHHLMEAAQFLRDGLLGREAGSLLPIGRKQTDGSPRGWPGGGDPPAPPTLSRGRSLLPELTSNRRKPPPGDPAQSGLAKTTPVASRRTPVPKGGGKALRAFSMRSFVAASLTSSLAATLLDGF